MGTQKEDMVEWLLSEAGCLVSWKNAGRHLSVPDARIL